MYFDRNISKNKDGKKNEGSYWSCVTNGEFHFNPRKDLADTTLTLFQSFVSMSEQLKAPTMSICNYVVSLVRVCFPAVTYLLWRLYLRKATKNSHSKEIGDWHNFRHLPLESAKAQKVSYICYKNKNLFHQVRGRLRLSQRLVPTKFWKPSAQLIFFYEHPGTYISKNATSERSSTQCDNITNALLAKYLPNDYLISIETNTRQVDTRDTYT